MDIYENIIIGNFLYSFGAAMGTRSHVKELPLSVNLLQQTPLDRTAGDVLVRGSRVMRLLEFKRVANDDDKELAKLCHLERALSSDGMEDLASLSREVHWYIESEIPDGKLNLRIVPYLDFQNTFNQYSDLNQFINLLVTDALRSPPDRSEIFSRYLELVGRCQGSIKGASGGLIVSVDVTGKVNYVVVEDLRELGLQLEKFHSLYLQRHIERQHQYERQRSHSYSELEREGYSL